MNHYLHKQYLETKAKYSKFSSRLLRSQEKGEFQMMTRRKQNYLLSRIKKLWEKLHLLEMKLKITSVGASLAFMLMVSNANAQNFVAAPEKNPLPPPSVFGFNPILVDIDNDGDMDLVASEDYSGINLFLNTGTPSAPNFEKMSGSNNPFNAIPEEVDFEIWDIVDFGDLDGDGDIDIISDDGYLIRNTGSNSEIVYTAESFESYFPGDSKLGDLDNDGDLDLLNMNGYYHTVELYENTGSAANFQIDEMSKELAVANWDDNIDYVDDHYVADLDNDGDLDILFVAQMYSGDPYSGYSYYSELRLIRNNGTASVPDFGLLAQEDNPYSTISTQNISLGDMDDDGDYDMILFSYITGMEYVERTADGVAVNNDFIKEFSDGVVLPSNYFIPPQFVDYDADGDLDLIAYSYEENKLYYYVYEETGKQLKYTLNKEKEFPFMDPEVDIQLPYFLDMDMDGDLDVVSLKYNYYDEIVFYELHRNNGTTAAPDYADESLADLTPSEYSYFPSFVDIDNDGDMDVFFIGNAYDYYDNEIVEYFENTGSGSLEFTKRTGSENPLDALNNSSFIYKGILNLEIADVDGDGDYDVVTCGYYGEIYYFENTGTKEAPVFTDKSQDGYFSQLSAGYYGQVNLVDLDGDGDNDLFTHEIYGMITKYYENTGPTGIKPNRNFNTDDHQLYPNPAGDELFLRLGEDFSGSLEYHIFSIEGKELLNGRLGIPSGNGEFTVRTAELEAGMYMIRIRSGEEVSVLKFLKK